MLTRLSVNINKVATLRNARGGNTPDVVRFAQDCEEFGADGITVHPRPDERHIRFQDVIDLKDAITTEFNIEGYPDKRYMDMVLSVKPDQATLVPDPPGVLTSNTGWNTVKHLDFLKEIIGELKAAGIRTSIFLNADPALVESAALTGTHRIELYTGPYAENYAFNRQSAIEPYVKTAFAAQSAGLMINAGHDLNLLNLAYFKQQIKNLAEVSIGHALISDALYFGIANTIQMYKRLLKD